MTVNTATPDYIVDGVLTDGEAWVALATHVVSGTSTTTITFTSSTGANDWSQYQDLVLISYGRNGGGGASVMKMNFNNDTGGNYKKQQLYTDGSSVYAAESFTNTYLDFFWYPPNSTTANEVACSIVSLHDINSGKHKTVTCQIANDMTGAGYAALVTNTWMNQAAITEIDLTDYSGDYVLAGSRFDLFGVLPRMVTA